jgi:aryl-alcohol dehydrogenase-like predicted oxidoreductase
MAMNVAETLEKGRGMPVPKREFRDGIQLSIVGFGGIVVVGREPSVGKDDVAWAFDRGVNYFDVAPSYFEGEAERKLGVSLQPYRNRSFLACKTTKRDAEGARSELEHSLKRLKTEHFDLYQFHAVTTMDDVEQILGAGGALETYLKAKEEGKIRYIGFSTHNEAAAISLLDQFDFDSVLFPVNFVCYAQGNFGPGIMAKAQEKRVARLALKGLAHRPWGEDEERLYLKTWYRPFDEKSRMAQALRFTLSEPVTAALPPGDEDLFRLAVDMAAAFEPLSADERSELLASARETTPIFST